MIGRPKIHGEAVFSRVGREQLITVLLVNKEKGSIRPFVFIDRLVAPAVPPYVPACIERPEITAVKDNASWVVDDREPRIAYMTKDLPGSAEPGSNATQFTLCLPDGEWVQQDVKVKQTSTRWGRGVALDRSSRLSLV